VSVQSDSSLFPSPLCQLRRLPLCASHRRAHTQCVAPEGKGHRDQGQEFVSRSADRGSTCFPNDGFCNVAPVVVPGIPSAYISGSGNNALIPGRGKIMLLGDAGKQHRSALTC